MCKLRVFAAAAAVLLTSDTALAQGEKPTVESASALTQAGAPQFTLGYQTRFADPDYQLFVQQGIDNVSVALAGMREAASWAMLLSGLGFIGAVKRRRSNVTVAA